MRPSYLVPAIVVAALGAIGVPDAVRRAIQSDVSAFPRPACAGLAAERADAPRPAASLPAEGDRACPSPEERFALAPVPEERKEPTLAPPEPANEHAPGQIVVVRVEGEVPAPGELLPAMVPTPEPQDEPTPAPPEPPMRLARAWGPHTIVLEVDAEQTPEAGLPADDGVIDMRGLTVP
jgi:hypothetical protein